MEKDFEKLIEGVYTKDQLNAFIEDVEEADRSIYKKAGGTLSKKIKGRVSAAFVSKIEKLEKNNELPSTKSGQKEFFTSWRRYLEKIPVVKLSLAFSPGQEFLEKLAGWWKKQSGSKAVFDICVQEAIVAGCVFEYQGEHRDYSLRPKLEEVLKSQFKK